MYTEKKKSSSFTMHVSAQETVSAPGRFLLFHNSASAQTGHCRDGAKELAEVWPGEHRGGLGGAAGLIWQPELPFVLLKELWEGHARCSVAFGA